jgi:large subunit ribosomal protein L21
MYAVIETGGKQYRVEVGTELEVELLDAQPGQSITLDRVLLVGDGEDTAIGRPVVANAAVEVEVLRRDRGEKLIVFKYRPKARRRVKKGHRQDHTVLRVTDVKLGNKSAAALVRKQEQDAKTERERLEEAAARQAAEDAALAAKLAKRSDTPKAGSKTATKTASTTTPKTTAKAADAADSKPKTSRSRAAGVAKVGESASAEKPARRTRAKATDDQASASDTPKRRRTKKDE